MQMISFIFFGFVMFVFILLYCVNKFIKNESLSNNIANWILLISSYLLILYVDWRFVLVILFTTVSTWFFAHKKNSLGIIINLLILIFFKYTNFFIKSFESLFGHDIVLLNIILPLGISFYIFSAIGYLVDVKKGKLNARSFKDVALYLSFFPKLTSGPIQKSSDFFNQIDKVRKIGFDTFSPGIQIFVFGLFKKLVFADRLSVFVDQVYSTPMAFGSFTVLLAAIAYAFQIYFDFSGYSDMAIGVGKILGFELPKNFDLPYLSRNVTEFWKRWHITLSSWLQEYLYIGLGGNRKGKIRTYINLLLTMILGGLWHGANWTYIIWGLLHGLALVVHKLWMKITNSNNRKSNVFGKITSTVLTFIFITFCWIFFRAESMEQALSIIKIIFEFKVGLEQPYLWLFLALIVWFVVIVFAYNNSKKNNNLETNKNNYCHIHGYYPIVDLTKFWGLVFFFTFCGLLLCLAYAGGSPFIYGNY